MNLALTGGLLGMGYLLSTDDVERPLLKSSEMQKKTNRGGSTRSADVNIGVYDQSISRMAHEYERDLVTREFPNLRHPESTNVVPPYSNSRIFNDPRTSLSSSSSSSQRAEVTSSVKYVNSLSGKKIAVEDFTHGNMVPFFGSHIRQNVDSDSTRSIVENFSGSLPVNWLEKREVGALFEPQKDNTFVHGMPEKTSRTIDRYNPSIRRQGEKPFQQEYVGPGLGLSYSDGPVGGFQQDIREFHLPKTIDELRRGSNIKSTYEGRLKPSKNLVTNRGLLSEMQKKMPDTYYENSEDRYFTTVGHEKEMTYRSEIVERDVTRPETSREYTGSATPATVNQGDLRAQEYTETNKMTVLAGPNIHRNVKAAKKITDYGKSTYVATETNRAETGLATYTSNVYSIFKAMFAPLEDIMRETRNETLVEKSRATSGNLQKSVKEGFVHDPEDVARTTVREGTEIHDHQGFLQADKRQVQSHDPDARARTTVKETTEKQDHQGFMGADARAVQSHDPEGKARTTVKETTEVQDHQGFMGADEGRVIAKEPGDKTRTTVKETTENQDHVGFMGADKRATISYKNDIARVTIKELSLHDSGYGQVQASVPKGQVYDPANIPKTTTNETLVLYPRTGNVGTDKNAMKIDLNVWIPKGTAREQDVVKTTLIAAHKKKGLGYTVTDATAPTTIRETTTDNDNYIGAQHAQTSMIGAYKVTEFDTPMTQREVTSDVEFLGVAVKQDGKNPQMYDTFYNADIQSKQEELLESREPTISSAKSFAGKESVESMESHSVEQSNDFVALPTPVSKIYQAPSVEAITKEKIVVFDEKELKERISPELLDAFHENPYTKSLHSTN